MFKICWVQVVRDCPTPEAGEYAAHALGSLACDNLHNANLMIEVDDTLIYSIILLISTHSFCIIT